MSGFEFYFSFFGLLLGLTVAEVATKFADAIGARKRVRLGILTPLLAIVILYDVAGFWMWVWSAREFLSPTWPLVYGGLFVAVSYFLSAALVFPREAGEWPSLDDYYASHKRFVVGGVLMANLIILGFQLGRLMPALSDVWFFFWQGAYLLPLAALLFVRSRRANIALLAWMLMFDVIMLANVLPNSEWGDRIGLNDPASTASPAPGRE